MIRGIALLWSCAAFAATVDGTLTGAGKPIANALVVLEGQHDSYVAQTDAHGRFRIQDVLPATYALKPEREGFAAGRIPVRCVVASEDLHLELKMTPLGAIAGRITDPEGEPTSHARVEAMRYAYPQGKRRLAAVANSSSDDRGEYRLGALAPGRYTVRASLLFSGLDTGTAAMRILGERPALTYGYTQSREIEVSPGGEVRDVNVQLQPEQHYTIRATVNAPPDVRVMVSANSTDPRPGLFGAIGGSMVSGRVIIFSSKTPGQYVVEASDNDHHLYARRIVQVVNADVDVALDMAPALHIGGAVVIDGSSTISRAGVRVTFEAPEEWNSITTPVGADGAFTIQHAEHVAYRIRVAIPRGGYLKSIHQGTRVLATPLIDLSRATDPLSITIGTDGATLDGAGAEGASVVLVPSGPLADWPDLVRSATAGENGAFRITDIAPGSYLLFIWDDVEPGAPLDPEFRAAYVDKAVPVVLKAGEHRMMRE